MKLKIKRLNNDAKPPAYAKEGDAGLDLFSAEDYTLAPKTRHLFKMGFAMEIERGYVALDWDKSGLAYKKGIKTMGGVIEHTYRGELGIILYNTSDEPFEVKKGDKVAQLLFQPIARAEVEETATLSETVRGTGGFGSTGR